jgi:hypothetical protein
MMPFGLEIPQTFPALLAAIFVGSVALIYWLLESNDKQAPNSAAASYLRRSGRNLNLIRGDGSVDWETVRGWYLMDHSRTYLNTGGLGPALRHSIDAAASTTNELQTKVVTGHELLAKARKNVAAFFGADEDEIALTRNATEGNSLVASGLVHLRRWGLGGLSLSLGIF